MVNHSAPAVPVSPHENALDPAPSYITTRGWSLDYLLSELPNAKATTSVQISDPNAVSVITNSLDNGLPVVLHGLAEHKNWQSNIFTLRHTQKSRVLGATDVLLRDEKTRTQRESTFAQFVRHSLAVNPFRTGTQSTRLHAIDVPPPKEWRTWLKPIHHNVMPEFLLPLGPCDLLQHLPAQSRAETTMCYFGVGDTFSPWYKDPCGSIAHNLLVDTNNHGSTFYFIVATRDSDRFASWLHSLGQEIDRDYGTHFSSLELLKTAPVDIYIAHQHVGSLVIMPPRACYQRIIYRGVNSSIAWSRVTLASIPFALRLELPIYNRTGRSEVYRSKLTLFYTMLHYATELDNAYKAGSNIAHLVTVSVDLLELLDEVIINEWAPGVLELPDPDLEADMHVICDFCGSDVFITYLECAKCLTGSEDLVAICSLCFASGRTCRCTRKMYPALARSFQGVLEERNRVAKIIEIAHNNDPLPEMSQPRIQKSRALQTFRAAVLILDARKEAEKSAAPASSCAPSSDTEHGSPAAHVLTCDECDVSLCFTHVLTSPARLHATSAARSFFIDKSGKRSDREQSWHDLHTLSAEARFEEMRSDTEDVDYYVASAYLAAVANKYQLLVPNEDRGLCTKAGWYDRFVEPMNDDRFEQEQEEAARNQEEVANIITSRILKGSSWKHGFSSTSSAASILPSVPRRRNDLGGGPTTPPPATQSDSEKLLNGPAEVTQFSAESPPASVLSQREPSMSRPQAPTLTSSTVTKSHQRKETELSGEDETLTAGRHEELSPVVIASSKPTTRKMKLVDLTQTFGSSHLDVKMGDEQKSERNSSAKKRRRVENLALNEKDEPGISTIRTSAQDSRPGKKRRVDDSNQAAAAPDTLKGDAIRMGSSLKTKAKIGSADSVPVHKGRPSRIQLFSLATATTVKTDSPDSVTISQPSGDQVPSSTESQTPPPSGPKLPRLKMHSSAAAIRSSFARLPSFKRISHRQPASSSQLSHVPPLPTEQRTSQPDERAVPSVPTSFTSTQATEPQALGVSRLLSRGESPLFTDEEWSYRDTPTPSSSSTRPPTPPVETNRTHSPPPRAVLSRGELGSMVCAGSLELCVGAVSMPSASQSRSTEELYTERVRAVKLQKPAIFKPVASAIEQVSLSGDVSEDRPEVVQVDGIEFIWRAAELRPPPPCAMALDQRVEDLPSYELPDESSDSAPAAASDAALDPLHLTDSPLSDLLDDSWIEPVPISLPVSYAASPCEQSFAKDDSPEVLQPSLAKDDTPEVLQSSTPGVASSLVHSSTTPSHIHHMEPRGTSLAEESALPRERIRSLQLHPTLDDEVVQLRERVRELEHDINVRMDEQQHNFKATRHDEERRHRAALEKMQVAMHEQSLKHAADTRKLRAESDDLRNAQARAETERATISADTRRVQLEQTTLRAEITSLRFEITQRNRDLVSRTKDNLELRKELDDARAKIQKLQDESETAYAASKQAAEMVSELREAHAQERAAWLTIGNPITTALRSTLVPTPATTPRATVVSNQAVASAVLSRVKKEPITIDLSRTSPPPDELRMTTYRDPTTRPAAAARLPMISIPTTSTSNWDQQPAGVDDSPGWNRLSAASTSGWEQQQIGTNREPGWSQLPLITGDGSAWSQSLTSQTQQHGSRGRSSSPRHRPSQFGQSQRRRPSRERESGRDRNSIHNQDLTRGHRPESQSDRDRHGSHSQDLMRGRHSDRERESDRDRNSSHNQDLARGHLSESEPEHTRHYNRRDNPRHEREHTRGHQDYNWDQDNHHQHRTRAW